MNPVLEIKFKSVEHLENFMKWLDGSGEQDYFIWTEENMPEVPDIKYDYKQWRITVNG